MTKAKTVTNVEKRAKPGAAASTGLPVPKARSRKAPAAPDDGQKDPAPKTPAEAACDRLLLFIRQFESQLDQSQEIAMGFAGGEAGVLRIEGLGYSAPDIMTFYGQDDAGVRTQLIQHVSQLSVVLKAVPKAEPEEPPLRIGFRLLRSWGGGESGDGSAWQNSDS